MIKKLVQSILKSLSYRGEPATDEIKIIAIGPSNAGKTTLWITSLLQRNTPDGLEVPEGPFTIVIDNNANLQSEMELEKQFGTAKATRSPVKLEGKLLFPLGRGLGMCARKLTIWDYPGSYVTREPDDQEREEFRKNLSDTDLLLILLPPELLYANVKDEDPSAEADFIDISIKQYIGTVLETYRGQIGRRPPFIALCYSKVDQYGHDQVDNPRIISTEGQRKTFQALLNASSGQFEGAWVRFCESLGSQPTQILDREAMDANDTIKSAIQADLVKRTRRIWANLTNGHQHSFMNGYLLAAGPRVLAFQKWESRGLLQVFSDFAAHLRIYERQRRYRSAAVFGMCCLTLFTIGSAVLMLIGQAEADELNGIANRAVQGNLDRPHVDLQAILEDDPPARSKRARWKRTDILAEAAILSHLDQLVDGLCGHVTNVLAAENVADVRGNIDTTLQLLQSDLAEVSASLSDDQLKERLKKAEARGKGAEYISQYNNTMRLIRDEIRALKELLETIDNGELKDVVRKVAEFFEIADRNRLQLRTAPFTRATSGRVLPQSPATRLLGLLASVDGSEEYIESIYRFLFYATQEERDWYLAVIDAISDEAHMGVFPRSAFEPRDWGGLAWIGRFDGRFSSNQYKTISVELKRVNEGEKANIILLDILSPSRQRVGEDLSVDRYGNTWHYRIVPGNFLIGAIHVLEIRPDIADTNYFVSFRYGGNKYPWLPSVASLPGHLGADGQKQRPFDLHCEVLEEVDTPGGRQWQTLGSLFGERHSHLLQFIESVLVGWRGDTFQELFTLE